MCWFVTGSFDLEPVCGRPKGMKVNTADPTHPLIVLDSYRGLLQVDTKTGDAQVLLHSSTGCYKTMGISWQYCFKKKRATALFIILMSFLTNTFSFWKLKMWKMWHMYIYGPQNSWMTGFFVKKSCWNYSLKFGNQIVHLSDLFFPW